MFRLLVSPKIVDNVAESCPDTPQLGHYANFNANQQFNGQVSTRRHTTINITTANTTKQSHRLLHEVLLDNYFEDESSLFYVEDGLCFNEEEDSDGCWEMDSPTSHEASNAALTARSTTSHSEGHNNLLQTVHELLHGFWEDSRAKLPRSPASTTTTPTSSSSSSYSGSFPNSFLNGQRGPPQCEQESDCSSRGSSRTSSRASSVQNSPKKVKKPSSLLKRSDGEVCRKRAFSEDFCDLMREKNCMDVLKSTTAARLEYERETTQQMEDFIQCLGHPSSLHVWGKTERFITAHNIKGEVQPSVFFRFVKETTAQLSHPKLARVWSARKDSNEDDLANYIMRKLNNTVLLQAGNMQRQDKLLSAKLSELRVRLESIYSTLGVPYIHKLSQHTLWKHAVHELRSVSTDKTPLDKLNRLSQACSLVLHLLRDFEDRPTADAFLPAMIVLLTYANPLQLHSSITFIQTFGSKYIRTSFDYNLTTLLIAIQFCENLD